MARPCLGREVEPRAVFFTLDREAPDGAFLGVGFFGRGAGFFRDFGLSDKTRGGVIFVERGDFLFSIDPCGAAAV